MEKIENDIEADKKNMVETIDNLLDKYYLGELKK